MKGALVVCLVLVNIVFQGFTQEKSSYPIASPLASFKWRIYNPRSVSTRYAIITQFIANNSLVVIPEKIHKISVKKIERSAFFRCSEMSHIIFPDTVNHIGSSAFNRCSQLSKIIIPKEVSIIRASTFFRCFNLNSVQLSENIFSIREYAFSNCRNLKEITIPSKVRSIENNAFSECHGLEKVIFLGNAPKENPEVFQGSEPIIYRSEKSKGWRETWCGRPVKIITDSSS